MHLARAVGAVGLTSSRFPGEQAPISVHLTPPPNSEGQERPNPMRHHAGIPPPMTAQPLPGYARIIECDPVALSFCELSPPRLIRFRI
jgi:hypothetical protein